MNEARLLEHRMLIQHPMIP